MIVILYWLNLLTLLDLKNTHRNGRPHHFEGVPLFSKRVDTIDSLVDRLHQLEYRIYLARSRSDNSFETDSSCFVIYEDVLAANSALKDLNLARKLVEKLDKPVAKMSPNFSEIVWESIGMDKSTKMKRKSLAFLCLCGLFLLWLIIQSLITTLSSLETWRGFNQTLALVIENSQVLVVVVTSFLVPALMALLNYLLPFVLRWVSFGQGLISLSIIEKSTMIKYFVFQVLLVLVHISFSIVPSLILSLANGEKSNVSVNLFIISLLNNFVSLSTLYINFMLTGFTYFGLELVQGGSLALAIIHKLFSRQTPRAQQKMDDPPSTQFTTLYGFLIFIYLLGSCYSLIAPLIVPFTALSFGLAYGCMKYQLFFVYDTKIETGGSWWPKVFNLMCLSLLLFQLLTLGSILVVASQSSTTLVNEKEIGICVLMLMLPLSLLAFWLYIKVYILPQSSYIDSNQYHFVANTKLQKNVEDDQSFQRVFNPVSFQPLSKIRLSPEMQELVPSLYSPLYQDEYAFIARNSPNRAPEPRKTRLQEIATSQVMKKRSLAAFIFSSRPNTK